MAAMATIFDFRSEQFREFGVQVTPMLPTEFQVSWPLGSGEEQNIFPKMRSWPPSWISDRNKFSFF